MLAETAERYRQLNTSKPITLRINQLDLIKVKAKRNNIPLIRPSGERSFSAAREWNRRRPVVTKCIMFYYHSY